MKKGVKIKYNANMRKLMDDPAAFFDYLPCPAEGCVGKSKSSDKGKTFVCPKCNSVQVVKYK